MLKAPAGISWYVIRCISWSPYGSKTSCYQLCQGPLMDWVRGFQTSLLPVWIIHVLGKGYLSYWDCSCHLFSGYIALSLIAKSYCPNLSENCWGQLASFLMPCLPIYSYSFGFAQRLLKTAVVAFSVLSLVFSLHCSCCSKSSSWL